MSEETNTGDQQVSEIEAIVENAEVNASTDAGTQVTGSNDKTKEQDPNKGWKKRVDRQARQIRELTERLAERERKDAERESQSRAPVDLKSLPEEERVQHLVKQGIREELEQTAYIQNLNSRLEEVTEIARKEIPDYDEVVNPDRQVMIESDAVLFIANSEVGGHLRYELMKDPKKVQMLNSLPESVRQARLVRMETDIIRKLEATQAGQSRTQGKVAPTPPNPVRGHSSAAPAKDPEKMSMSEYRAWFQAKKDAARKK